MFNITAIAALAFFCKFNLQIIPKFNPGQKPVMLLNGMRQDEPIAWRRSI